ncbi:centriolar coiled-coil protein, partial [Clarias magur]
REKEEEHAENVKKTDKRLNCTVMESYEEFCLKSLARMHMESGCRASHNHMEAQSSIRFHGSHALLPKLSDQQRAEMAEQRQRAVQREAERHTVRIRSLLNRVQDVIQHEQLQKGQVDEVYQVVEAPCIQNTTQPQIVKKEKTQHNQCSVTVNHQRLPPAPFNQSYDVGSPSQTTLRPQEQQKAACRLTAAARGFLTRRLLQTEKIKLLNKIIQDSIEVIRAFQAATHQRRASFTMQDLRLQYRVRAQLHTARCDVHEIFFAWPLSDRIALLQQDRELHNERRRKVKSEQNTPCQSSVTQNSLGFIRQRMLQQTQSQNTPVFSQKLKPA